MSAAAGVDVEGEPGQDPLLVDAEALRGLASDAVVKRGIRYFKEDRVHGLGWLDGRVWASVEGSQRGEPYAVELAVDEDGEIGVECSCPFDQEPTCKHAVATLLAYAARQEMGDETVRGAADEAVADRRKRGRTEVTVRHVGGDRWFGTWEARSLNPTGVSSRTYRVELRYVGERINHCTCPDFATNRLGTCKHIEAVVHKLASRAHRKAAREAQRGPVVSVVYLDWQRMEEPVVRVRRGREVPEDLDGVLARYFDGDVLREPRVDTLARLRGEVEGREDIHLSRDALEHVQRMAEDAAHAREAARIRRQIRRSGGHIEGVQARLYPYQVEGVAFLASTGRAVLADDMGLGKTLQTIAAATWMTRERGVRRVLVVCPASLKHQWAREIEKFTGDEAVVVQGPPGARRALYRRKALWTLVNYELVLRDLDVLRGELAPDLLVLDEAQRIKNWRTKTADAIKAVPSRYAFVLTGTPLENRLEDLYSILQVVDRRVLGPLWHFLLEFHVTDESGKVLGYRNLSELRRRIAPVLLRRDRAIVADQLPERIVQQVDVPMSKPQKSLEAEALNQAAMLQSIKQRRPLTPSEEHSLMAALQTARMACNAAQLVDEESKAKAPKLEELGRLLEELCVDGGRKVVVFSQWERMTRMAEEEAHKLGLGTVRLHGGVPSGSRGKLMERFREEPDCQVFLSTDAGGVGLNLQSASALINLEMPWNPAVLDQRIARVHRLGQKETAHILLMVSADSYEERVAGIVESKRHLFAHTVGPDASEDVVGISRKTLDLAMEALDESPQGRPGETEQGEREEKEREPSAEEPTGGRAIPHDDDGSLAKLVAEIQRRCGPRVERIVARRTGLLVVVDPPAEGDQQLAALAPEGLEVAVVDPGTFASLRRLGLASIEESDVVVERSEEAEAPPADPLGDLARRKLRAGEVLVQQGCHAEGLSLLVEAMAAAVARMAGAAEAPKRDDLTVWLYGEALPSGRVSQQDATALLRADGLSRAPAVPESLVAEVLRDARTMIPDESSAAQAGAVG